MKKIFLEVLNKKQQAIFKGLHFLEKEDFYLAGGTGLALQLKHRTSVDFDFYTQKHFDPERLFKKIDQVFPQKAEKISKAEDTLYADINQVSTSYFWYQYPLKLLVRTIGPALASIEDIAAMKLLSISSRATKRDYIDIYFLLKEFELKKLFALVRKKYSQFNPYFALRALTYFEDIKESRGRIKIFDKKITWEQVKKGIFEKVRAYQLGMFKR